jgi:hypothetical protein
MEQRKKERTLEGQAKLNERRRSALLSSVIPDTEKLLSKEDLLKASANIAWTDIQQRHFYITEPGLVVKKNIHRAFTPGKPESKIRRRSKFFK